MCKQSDEKSKLKRVSFRMPSKLLRDFDDKVKQRGYKDRSEALREATRKFIREPRKEVNA
ncbi:MAG: Transcriptional regulator CopG/Arc/MetJ family [Candidatus Methanohalarchaeum thermophilum]|uniref:Transcriptional regulator CopG/Arc/MetJ family n=1 Tax=Methanohalarchaeum thermophilum TaxID=1903181 RepID=A0A1Q6DRY3_METT1|nr:MAG: Transcriptional regulator CopG/Arc/MetJ family [Candidatus Methanohalarchaeum thermophilum]